jgi:hypothetical protein
VNEPARRGRLEGLGLSILISCLRKMEKPEGGGRLRREGSAQDRRVNGRALAGPSAGVVEARE